MATSRIKELTNPSSVSVPSQKAQSTVQTVKQTTIPKPTVSQQTTSVQSVPKAASVPAPTQSIPVDKIYQTSSQTVPKAPTQVPTYQNQSINDWSQKQRELFSQLENVLKTPFSYDPNNDAALQSQKALYQAGAKTASRDAMETMNERGLLQSDLTNSQLAQIEQNANTQFNALIPQYQQMAYNQYLDGINNASNLLGQAGNIRGQEFNEGVTQAELTGTYLPPGAQSLVDNIYALKAQAESGVSAQQRAQLSSQADQLRAQLNAMGVDTSGLGANVALNNTAVGQRTMAGQQMDYAQRADQRDFDYNQGIDQRNFDYAQGIDQRNFDYGRERDQVADEQFIKQFNEQVRQFGMNNALNWAQQAVSQQNANVNSGQLGLSREKFNYDKEQDALNRASSSTTKAGTNGYDYKTDPTYIATLQGLYNNPSAALNDLRNNAQIFVEALGQAGFDDLLKRAKAEAE